MLRSKNVVVRGMTKKIKFTDHALDRSDLRTVEQDLIFDTIEVAYEAVLDDSAITEGDYPNYIIYHKDYRISCACELQQTGMNVITVCMNVLEPDYAEQKVFEVDVRDRVVIKKGADYL